MQILFSLFALLTPCMLGTWVGTSNGRPLQAFFVGWLATPMAAFVMAFVNIFFRTIRTRGARCSNCPSSGSGQDSSPESRRP